MVFVKNWPVFDRFILGTISQENVFYDILEKENAFLGFKNKKCKMSRNWDISKGGTPWFWSKIGHFIVFLF